MNNTRLLFLIMICLCCFTNTKAQYFRPENRIWAMGNKVGLDFTNGNPTVIATNMTNAAEGSATVCDTNGNLQFYTNGSTIWNKNGVVMTNGAILTPGGSASTTSSTTQGAVIVPVPGVYGKYYVFSLTAVSNCKLYCNLVDMSLNNGLGDVDVNFSLRNTLIRDSLSEKMTAVAGCNNSVWLVVHTEKTTLFRAYHITTSGIDLNPVISNAGNFTGINYQQGVMKFSTDRTKLLNCNFRATNTNNAGLEVFDFDYATGIISNPVTLDSNSYYGGTFNSEGNKVYAQTTIVLNSGTVYQYDLNNPTPAQSKTLLGPCGQYADMKLAPDGKIYFGALAGGQGFSYYKYMGRINNPNAAGTACGFQDSVTSLMFPGSGFGSNTLTQGLPNEVVVPMPNQTGNMFVKHPDTLICSQFTSMQLYAPAGYDTYTWENGNGDSSRPILQRGTYWVRSETPCAVRVDTFVIKGGDMPNIQITAHDSLLTANAGYPNYQWYKDGQPINGAIDTAYIATESGRYTVLASDPSGCSDSASYQLTIVTTGISSVHSNPAITVYPNPANTFINIKAAQAVNAIIYSMDGRTLLSKENAQMLDISNLAEGVYLLQLTDTNNKVLSRERIIKSGK